MMEYLTLYIGLNLIVALLFPELFGAAAGGLILPAFVAISASNPMIVFLTLLAGLIAFFSIRALSAVAILFGRRRLVLLFVVGYLVLLVLNYILGVCGYGSDLSPISYFIPGLFAHWCERQKIVETAGVLIIGAAMVRLIAVLVLGVKAL